MNALGMVADLAGDRTTLDRFRVLYCAWLAAAVAVQLPRQIRHVSERGAGRRMPQILDLVTVPKIGPVASLATGLALVAALGWAAADFAGAAALLVAGAAGALVYFAQVIELPEVRRKVNTVPIILLLLGSASFVPAAAADEVARLARWTIQLVVVQIYLASGVMKLRHAGFRWADGATLRTALLRSHLSGGNRAALWLARRSWATRLAAGFTLAFDLTFWLVLPFPALAWVYVPLGIGFHAATAGLMRIHYWIYVLPAYLVFFRW